MCEGWIRLVVEVYVYVRGDCIWHVRVRCDVRRCVIFLRFTFFTEPHASSKTRHNSQTAHSSATLPRIENNNSRQQLNENHKKSNLTARSAAHGHTSLLISHGGAIPCCCCCFARFALLLHAQFSLLHPHIEEKERLGVLHLLLRHRGHLAVGEEVPRRLLPSSILAGGSGRRGSGHCTRRAAHTDECSVMAVAVGAAVLDEAE